MADVKEAKPRETASETEAEPVGRVEFDSRGNSVWRWAREMIDSTSVLLKRLENSELSLEPTRKLPGLRPKPATKSTKPTKPAKDAKPAPELRLTDAAGRDSGGGFDPYNSRR